MKRRNHELNDGAVVALRSKRTQFGLFVLAAAIGSHGVYDTFHFTSYGSHVAPGWYPQACLTFDVPVDMYLFSVASSSSRPH